MSGRQTSNPWSVLDQVGGRIRQGFGTSRLETNDTALPQSIRRGLDPDRIAVLLESHAISAGEIPERRS